mmetsp:Transcript_26867/g.4891  ORF Transcript_26867/g.4891 Transcript_26867/m.4891 type:complete len:88 (-) Transcript_26867:44-307(-)
MVSLLITPASLLPSPITRSNPSFMVLVGIFSRQFLSCCVFAPSNNPFSFTSLTQFFHFYNASFGLYLIPSMKDFIIPLSLLPYPTIL